MPLHLLFNTYILFWSAVLYLPNWIAPKLPVIHGQKKEKRRSFGGSKNRREPVAEGRGKWKEGGMTVNKTHPQCDNAATNLMGGLVCCRSLDNATLWLFNTILQNFHHFHLIQGNKISFDGIKNVEVENILLMFIQPTRLHLHYQISQFWD